MERADFCKRLTQLRMNKGVSARDMSLSIGQSPNYINGIESGKTIHLWKLSFISATTLKSHQKTFLTWIPPTQPSLRN